MKITFETHSAEDAALFQQIVALLPESENLDTAVDKMKERIEMQKNELKRLNETFEANQKEREQRREELKAKADNLEREIVKLKVQVGKLKGDKKAYEQLVSDETKDKSLPLWGIYRRDGSDPHVIMQIHASTAERAVELYAMGFPDGADVVYEAKPMKKPKDLPRWGVYRRDDEHKRVLVKKYAVDAEAACIAYAEEGRVDADDYAAQKLS